MSKLILAKRAISRIQWGSICTQSEGEWKGINNFSQKLFHIFRDDKSPLIRPTYYVGSCTYLSPLRERVRVHSYVCKIQFNPGAVKLEGVRYVCIFAIFAQYLLHFLIGDAYCIHIYFQKYGGNRPNL